MSQDQDDISFFCQGTLESGHPKIYLSARQNALVCPYCHQKFEKPPSQ